MSFLTHADELLEAWSTDVRQHDELRTIAHRQLDGHPVPVSPAAAHGVRPGRPTDQPRPVRRRRTSPGRGNSTADGGLDGALSQWRT